MGDRPFFDCRHPSLPRLLAIPTGHRRAARHLSRARGAPRPHARETCRTEGARHRKELWLAGRRTLQYTARCVNVGGSTDTRNAIAWVPRGRMPIATLTRDLNFGTAQNKDR